MNLTNENILISSLVKNKVIQQIPRQEIVENELSKHVTPPINIIPINSHNSELYSGKNYNDVELWMNDKAKAETAQFFPLSFKNPENNDWYLLPWEPMISIEANIILKSQSVASAQKNFSGTIKDRWAQDDYSITITGAFYGQKMRGSYVECYPREDMEKLRDLFLAAEAIQVKCEFLQIYGINKIAIKSMDFPFTKGEYVQAYEIKALSDFDWDLNFTPNKKNTLIVGTLSGDFDRTN
ncbi:hypothetical protein SAMN06264346_10219 [Chryseobacterium profundimaris]|uniref:DUF6046 domain-containing protein n=1 Tax=Chryseobacterium profundimaris TaxID=1387275 RepID=A0ABY1NGG7_9FLAO|nr:hypothetical protein SAMN06264346_10219 [Chryseobacterium profundimaris]